MTARARPVLVIAAVAALAVVGFADAGVRAVAGQADPAEQLLSDSRRAAEEHDFAGVLEVTWSDASGSRSHEVPVTNTGGVLALGDEGQVVVEGPRRFVHETQGWFAVWSSADQPAVPSPSQKWDLRVREGPVVAGRTTRAVEVAERGDGPVRERLSFDVSTGILLRRELLDRRGDIVRSVGFVSIGDTPGAFFGAVPAETPRAPRSSAARQPHAIDSVGSPFRAPERAGDGFRLSGRYRDTDGTVQLFYSDGLFGVSVFEQEGELDWNELPEGEARTVGDHDARQYRTPTGVVTVWESGDVVYTTVADAPADQLDELLADLAPTGSPSAFERVTSFVLGPFDW
jgi:hypothetical protein